MKNKRGFTLIELLAVIVILAIVALIATPIVLNMINSAKRSGAISSTYGYIDAIEYYQGFREIDNLPRMEEGEYDIVDDNINNLISAKGKKASAGKITITKNGSVGTAMLCMNGYLIDYQNKEATITSNSCGNMGLQISYIISSTEWEKGKELTINYPETVQERYFKVLSGKVLMGDTQVELNKDIKVTENTTLKLEENAEITSWIINEGSKLERSFKETKIDNVEIIEPTVTATAGYPTLTKYGMLASVSLDISNYNSQEGTSAYYSIDNGSNWIKYTEKTNIEASSIKVKMVRDESKRETDIKNATITSGTIKDALSSKGYDEDLESFYQCTDSCHNRFNISEEMIGKSISAKTYNGYYIYIYMR